MFVFLNRRWRSYNGRYHRHLSRLFRLGVSRRCSYDGGYHRHLSWLFRLGVCRRLWRITSSKEITEIKHFSWLINGLRLRNILFRSILISVYLISIGIFFWSIICRRYRISVWYNCWSFLMGMMRIWRLGLFDWFRFLLKFFWSFWLLLNFGLRNKLKVFRLPLFFFLSQLVWWFHTKLSVLSEQIGTYFDSF